MLTAILIVAIYPVTIALMLGIDALTGGVIAEAFGKDWPYTRGERLVDTPGKPIDEPVRD